MATNYGDEMTDVMAEIAEEAPYARQYKGKFE